MMFPGLLRFLSEKARENICVRGIMAFLSSSSSCRAALSLSPSLQFRFPLVRAFCVLSVGLTNLSPSSPSIIKTGCSQSHPLLPFFRKLTLLRKDKGKSQEAEEEDMFLCQNLRTRKRATFLMLTIMMMMMTWRFIITINCFSMTVLCLLSLRVVNVIVWLGLVIGLDHADMSKFTSQSSAKAIQSTGMEGNASTVPSIVVYVTVPNKEAGKKLAGSIIKEKLAACVNRVPGIESVYLWEGEIQTDSEELLIIKTRESLLEALTEHVKANHEYDLPEVISMPITGGNIKYLEWIKSSTRD